MAAALAPFLVTWAGCGGSAAASCGDTSATTFTQLAVDVWPSAGGSCAFSSCHGVGSHQGNLVLVSDSTHDAYAALINVAPDAAEAARRGWTPPVGLVRVKPGDEANSFLYQKLI